MAGQDSLRLGVQAVDRGQRVVGVLPLLGDVGPDREVPQPQAPDQRREAVLLVVDDRRSVGDVVRQTLPALPFGRLAVADVVHVGPAGGIHRGHDAALVDRDAPLLRAVRIAHDVPSPLRDERLVQEDGPGEDDVVLDPVQDEKDLFQPVTDGRHRISPSLRDVPEGRPGQDPPHELEPSLGRDLPVVEHRVADRGEVPEAELAPVPLHPRLRPSVLDELRISAVGTFERLVVEEDSLLEVRPSPGMPEEVDLPLEAPDGHRG